MGGCHGDQHPVEREARAELLPETESKEEVQQASWHRAGDRPLKSDHRMIRNFLKGTRGDAINTLMAAAAYNMRHWMNKHATSLFVSWLLALARRLKNTIFEHENQYACERSRLAIVAG